MKDVPEFIAEINAALESLDMDYARRMMAGHFTDDVRLIGMHKARYESIGCSRESRHASGFWLRARGYSRICGGPILPEGMLPE